MDYRDASTPKDVVPLGMKQVEQESEVRSQERCGIMNSDW
jgi:hypothetical protein